MNNQKLRIFVSSVQKELENERLTVLALVTTDSFLQTHYDAVLYEHAPASPEKSVEECLKLLDTCDVCLSIVGKEYGRPDNDAISITHREYRQAKQYNIPLLIFIKGCRETANNDFAVLLKLKIADKKGAGRSTNYIQASKR